jgi:iron complex outermembrane receptor protein
MKNGKYRLRRIGTGVAILFLLLTGGFGVSAPSEPALQWRKELQSLQGASDRELLDNRDAVLRIRRGVELWIELHPSSDIALEPDPGEPWSAENTRMQVSALNEAVRAILDEKTSRLYDIGTTTLIVQSSYMEGDFVGPLFTETSTRTEITGNGILASGPTAMMSITRALNLIPSVNQQSVDPVGLADSSNYHESFRFRGVEPTGGGNPSTPVNIENLPVSGRPGGGANIYDLENFRSISIYKGGIPAGNALGLTNIGGKIDMKVKRASEAFRFELKQDLGSYGFRRNYLRVEPGLLSTNTNGFLSYSNTHADKWKGLGGANRNNIMLGLDQKIGAKLKIELFSIYNKIKNNTYRPLDYTRASDLGANYRYEYSEDFSDYYFYGYNKNDFDDFSLFAEISYTPDKESAVTVKPFYWKDTGYYMETITRASGDNRVRKWDMDHTLKGVEAAYSRKMQSVYLNAGYSYLEQERPGPPTSWKIYTVTPEGLAFGQWQLLSNSSKHRQHAPFVSVQYSFGRVHLEGSLKYMEYEMPEIATYNTVGIGDIDYKEALDLKPPREENASAASRKFSAALPGFGLSYLLKGSLSSYVAYGRNHGMSVSLYPYFISQKNAFYAEGITLEDLWKQQKLEISDNFDFGLRYITDTLYIVPTFYYSRHKNKTATYYDASLEASYPSSVFGADAYGFELEAGAMPTKKLSVYASFSHNRFYFSHDIFDQSGAAIPIEGNQVPDAPEFLIKGIAGWQVGSFTVSPAVRFTSSRYGDILQQEKIAGATLFDLNISYKTAFSVIRRLDVSVAVNNLFNKEYISIINTSDYKTLGSSYQAGAPRTFQASAFMSF